jgi:streptogrisin B
MTRTGRPALLTLALLALAGLLGGTAQVAPATAPAPAPAPAPATATATAPAAATAAETATAEGVSCTSTRSCTPSHGGAYMLTSRNSCTAGFPVRSRSGQWYVLTAGHCVAEAAGSTWRQSGLALGIGTRWEYGGRGTEGKAGTSDIGLIKITANVRTWNARSRVVVIGPHGARTQQIIAAKDAKAGEHVCVTEGRTGVTRCGTVVTPSTSLSYASPGLPARTISNLALVKGICVNPGDSGSPVYAGRAAVGIAVARSVSGCYMWYTKLPAQLKHFGLSIAG